MVHFFREWFPVSYGPDSDGDASGGGKRKAEGRRDDCPSGKREEGGCGASGSRLRTGPDGSEILKQAVFFVYLLLAVRLLIFKYPVEVLAETAALWQKETVLEGLHTANFTLFKTIRMYIRYSDRLNSFENLAGNVAVFVPFGMLLPWMGRKYSGFFIMLCNAFLFTAGIELFQLLSGFGAFDVDDILLNCAGAALGWMAWQRASGRFSAGGLRERTGEKQNGGPTVFYEEKRDGYKSKKTGENRFKEKAHRG